MPEDDLNEALRSATRRALDEGRGSRRVVPLLQRLASCSAPGSDDHELAHHSLAEFTVNHQPWVALGHLKAIGGSVSMDPSVHALSGLAHARLGNLENAVRAFRRALELDPLNVSYQHNLGHILHRGLNRPLDAERYLRFAMEHSAFGPIYREIALSFVECCLDLRAFERGREALASLEVNVGKHRSITALRSRITRAEKGSSPRKTKSNKTAE